MKLELEEVPFGEFGGWQATVTDGGIRAVARAGGRRGAIRRAQRQIKRYRRAHEAKPT